MTSYSQAGQDKFAFEMSGQKANGVFLDVGAHDGRTNSNSLGLEEEGWRGLLVDIHPHEGLAARRNDFVICDATTADWPRLLELYLPDRYIDYLSLDVDEVTTAVLERLMRTGVIFGCITIEHDKYRLGIGHQTCQHGLLLNSGYDLICSDVIIEPGPGIPGNGGPFEDWYCHKNAIDELRRNRFRCHAQVGSKIVP